MHRIVGNIILNHPQDSSADEILIGHLLDSFENIYTSENIYSSEDDALTCKDTEIKTGIEGLYFDESMSLDENEEAYIKYIYEKTGRSVSETTAVLGISRTTLWRKLGSSANT